MRFKQDQVCILEGVSHDDIENECFKKCVSRFSNNSAIINNLTYLKPKTLNPLLS